MIVEYQEFLTREALEKFLLKNDIGINYYIIASMDLACEIHRDIKREDKKSSFLETHIWPVTRDVVKHYMTVNRNITGIEVASCVLHDIMEDNDRIVDWYRTKDYGFDAYLKYRFGLGVYKVCMDLKIKPLETFPGNNDEERQLARFRDYGKMLGTAGYDMKVIKLSDRVNNMKFISSLSGLNNEFVNDKIRRYLHEAEDFYLSFALLEPPINDIYEKLRESYDILKSLNKSMTS